MVESICCLSISSETHSAPFVLACGCETWLLVGQAVN